MQWDGARFIYDQVVGACCASAVRVRAALVTPSPPGLARQHRDAGEDGAEGELRVAAQQQIKRQRRRERNSLAQAQRRPSGRESLPEFLPEFTTEGGQRRVEAGRQQPQPPGRFGGKWSGFNSYLEAASCLTYSAEVSSSFEQAEEAVQRETRLSGLRGSRSAP